MYWLLAAGLAGVDVGLDVTLAGLGAQHARIMLELGVRPLIGTSGRAPRQHPARPELEPGRSRSHLIFTIRIAVRAGGDAKPRAGKLTICDLAGIQIPKTNEGRSLKPVLLVHSQIFFQRRLPLISPSRVPKDLLLFTKQD